MALKRTTEEVAEYFKKNDCELMDEYLGVQQPMDYRCKCGRYAVTTWNNFTKGKRCGYCHLTGRKKKYHIDEIKKIFSDRGCELLEHEYIDNKTPMRYRCKCGQEAIISFVGFYHQNQFCYECGLEKNRGPKHHRWYPDREKKRLKDLFRKKCYKALGSTLQATGKIKVGHTSDMLGYGPNELQQHITKHANWDNVKNGNWHIDHIFPVEAFIEHNITDIKLINCLENLRPLSQKDNNIKHAKYNKEEFKKWLATKGIVL